MNRGPARAPRTVEIHRCRHARGLTASRTMAVSDSADHRYSVSALTRPLFLREYRDKRKTTSIPMAKHLSRHSILSDTATHDKKSGDLRAVIETPKGSR